MVIPLAGVTKVESRNLLGYHTAYGVSSQALSGEVMVARLFLVLVLVSFSALLKAADTPPISPKEAAARIVLPKGFKATLFAGEPDLVQPIAFCFDDRGRVWCVENFSYPNFNTNGIGKDRVSIYEDTNGDGTFDKKTVVIDNGSNLSGIEYGFGGIWLCSAPNLLFIPIKDDKPSGPPQVILDGWNYKEAKHNIFNGLAWGPDGWLYGCNGIQATSYIGKPGTPAKDRTAMNCGIWRMKPTKPSLHTFEVVATGMTNPWGLDWDERGNMFATNCVIDHLFHIIPGGRYQRMYGKDLDPFAFELMDSCVDYKHWAGGHWTASRNMTKEHDEAGGGHAHSGCCVYLGDNFPKEYRNTIFSCNIHGNRLNNDGIQQDDNGVKGVRRPDFLFAKDPWFRGLACKYGPDGGLYVSDWYDTGECHNYVKVDQTNGRIFKVVFGTPKVWQGDLAKLSDLELVKLQSHKNEWFARHSRRLLQERSVANQVAITDISAPLQQLTVAKDPIHRLRALWLNHSLNLDVPTLAKTRDPDLDVRLWDLRLKLEKNSDANTLQAFADEYVLETSARYHSQYFGIVRKLPEEKKVALAYSILQANRPAKDRNTSLMLWNGLGQTLHSNMPLAKLFLLNTREGLVRELFARQHASDPVYDSLITDVLQNCDTDDKRIDILRGLKTGLAEMKAKEPRPQWSAVNGIEKWSPLARKLADEIAIMLGDPARVQQLTARMQDAKAPLVDRAAAIELLATANVPKLAPNLQRLLGEESLRAPALRALTRYSDPGTPAAILKYYASFTPPEKTDAVLCLCGRKDYAHALLDAVGTVVTKGDLSGFNARQILALNDKTLTAKLEAKWGTVRVASATKLEQTARLKKLLTSETLVVADATKGKALFTRNCGACHKLYGEGGDVGPDLTGGQRGNLDYVIENVLDPNAVVPFDMKMTTFYLADGRVVSGIIRKETPQSVTVRTANDTLVISVKEIETRKKTEQSLMPEGILEALTDKEIVDLIAFFSGTK